MKKYRTEKTLTQITTESSVSPPNRPNPVYMQSFEQREEPSSTASPSYNLTKSGSFNKHYAQKEYSSSPELARRKVQFKRQTPLQQAEPYKNTVSLNSFRSNDTSARDSSSYAMTPQELEMIKLKMKNDKVVGFYKKVLTDIREALSSERKQVQRYLK